MRLFAQQFLQSAVQSLTHRTVAHRLVALDAVLQHKNFIRVLFHNSRLFVLSAFRKAGFTSLFCAAKIPLFLDILCSTT